jgi:hypothetical protein
MKKAFFLVFLIFCSFFSNLLPHTSFVYEETTGNEKTKITYRTYKEGGKNLIRSESAKEEYFMTYSPNYQLEKISYVSKENKNHYEITANGSILSYEGTLDGNQVSKTFDLDGKPWIQNLSFGLAPFATSSQTSRTFFILNTKELTLYQMRAKKMDISTITVNGKSYKVQNIEVRLTGFKGLFWKAEIWFDVDTHQLIRYQTNEGPNSPLTTLDFIEKHSPLSF